MCLLLDYEQARIKIESMKNENEREVGMFFLNLGFNLLDCNTTILKTGTKQEVGEIDLLFYDNEYLFVIEVSKKKDNQKIISFFGKWSSHTNEEYIFSQFKSKRTKVFRLYINLHQSSKSPELERLASEKNNKIMYSEDYEYFRDNYDKIGIWERNDLLDWLEIEHVIQTEKTDAIQYYLGITPVFCFVM